MRINKWVWILPTILMVFMFYSGYRYLSEGETLSNEQIQDEIFMEVRAEKVEDNDLVISGNWDWTVLPQEGLLGEDYIGITVKNNTGQSVPVDTFTNAKLVLLHRDEVIFEASGEKVENGLIFSFPNEMVEAGIFGNQGEIEVGVVGVKNRDDLQFSMIYLHTWSEHEGLLLEDSRFQSPQFINDPNNEVDYWIVERFTTVQE